MKLLPGSPHPLGATWDGEGTNFALYSENATAVELCLFDADGQETREPLVSRTAYVWHAYAPGLLPGQRYGYRVHGPYEPKRGLRFNPNVVLLDPYAKAVDGVERWDRGCFAYPLGHPDGDLRANDAPQLGAPRGVVIDTDFDWEGDTPPRIPLQRSVIYEAHVRGLTMRHPEIPEAMRGTYAAIAHPAIVRHLRELGVTAIELMPIHAFVDDKILLDKGLRNYWGYSTIGYFAPDIRYRSGNELGSEVREFKTMVKALHRAGIEVILDVVYNHTAEGNHLGPTFGFKGIDNTTYYRLVANDPRYYFDYTGTGNTLNVRHPQVLALIMDSLRYWQSDMHVDGFRFDLASALARQLQEVDQLSSFFTSIHQSPQLRDVKLIAEPWDVGEGGYQVGNFPVRWAEWNGRYRDAVRAFWRGDGGLAGAMGYRLTGSSDLYQAKGRSPSASINLITAHDGFTLNDLVSYERKHNEANGEGNRDGADEHSANYGVEGPTTDPAINAVRVRQRKNLLATMFLSQGTPMLVAGDEIGRTQGGNNNAYCQDNAISWVDWNLSDEAKAFLEFTKHVVRLRRDHPSLHRSKFLQGALAETSDGMETADHGWFRVDGKAMTRQDWDNPMTESLSLFLSGRGIDDVDDEGRPLVDDNLLWLINASPLDLSFVLPEIDAVHEPWQLVLDTASENHPEQVSAGDNTAVVKQSLKLFRAPSRVIRVGGAVRTLRSTYRLQMSSAFGFEKAREILDYLAELGVTDVYSSPLLAAAPGSTHGYDVVDHSRMNPELGTEEQFVAWSDAMTERDMGLLLDWVPNHMGISCGQNRWWDDVMENGPSSVVAEHFDIDWAPPKQGLQDRVLLPILGDQYGESLERGELKVVWEQGLLRLAYYEKRLPLGPKVLAPVLELALSKLALPEQDTSRQEFESILSSMRHLPTRVETGPDQRKERAREKEVIKRRLSKLVDDSPEVKACLEAALVELNGTVGMPGSFDKLDDLLQNQSYRLASWRVAAEEINYRRFFDINELAAIRMEVPQVFEYAHELVFRLIHEGRVHALRLDHTDGLYDPRGYFEELQRRFYPTVRRSESLLPRGPDDAARPLPLLVEKILHSAETLPTEWPVDGTTGYEFLSAVRSLFIDRRSEPAFTAFYRKFTGDQRTFMEHVHEAKVHILRFSLASEVHMLARELERIAVKSRRWRDFTLTSLGRALVETIAAFPVYRTYLSESRPRSEQDERRIKQAIAAARRRHPSTSATVYSFIEDVLLVRSAGKALSDEELRERTRFALRFQQFTGPVMAKAVEDTVFYRYTRFVCLNEVGGPPPRFGVSVEEFHRQNEQRARTWPLSMIATSTHDTKRGEDTSACQAVLSEMPDEWTRITRRWSEVASRFKTDVDDAPAPSANQEYLFYQTLVGAWPFGWDGKSDRDTFIARMSQYVMKATKEAKQETSWTNPNAPYDEAVDRFVKGLLSSDLFMGDVRQVTERLARPAVVNALGQTLLRATSPGVCDTYQGAELWHQTLVDPDNRRPVDYARRRELLGKIRERLSDRAALCRDLLDDFVSGAVKLYVLYTLLNERKTRRDLFLRGDYEPLATGDYAVAYARSFGKERLVVCAPRLPYQLTNKGTVPWPLGPQVWKNERLNVPWAGTYRELFTGVRRQLSTETPMAEVFETFPIAAFIAE
jgi:isoamylase